MTPPFRHEIIGQADAFAQGERDMAAARKARTPQVTCYGGPCDGRKVRVPAEALDAKPVMAHEKPPPPFEMHLTLPTTVALGHLPIERRPLALYRLSPAKRALVYVRTESIGGN
jgi:hypothetical protein